jgi:hypothetical protein
MQLPILKLKIMSHPVDYRLIYLVGLVLAGLYTTVACIIFSSSEDRKKELSKLDKSKVNKIK